VGDTTKVTKEVVYMFLRLTPRLMTLDDLELVEFSRNFADLGVSNG